jgi:hypothetical protein
MCDVKYRSVEIKFMAFETEACLNSIQEFSLNRKDNISLDHYKDQLVKAV